MRRLRWVFVVPLFAFGCVTEQMVPWAYDVPVAGNSRGPQAAYNCVAACRATNERGSNGFFACLETCPDIHVVEGAECAPHPERESICYTQLVPEDVPDPEATDAVLSVIGALIDVGARVAAHESHRSSHHEHHHHR